MYCININIIIWGLCILVFHNKSSTTKGQNNITIDNDVIICTMTIELITSIDNWCNDN